MFSTENINKFVYRCRQAGITVPILPGLWIFDTYQRLRSCANFCKVKVDADVWDTVENLKADPASLRNYGIELIANIGRALLVEDEIVGVHLFSLNDLELVQEILKAL